MFNGPSYFNIRVDEYKPWMYIGKSITKKFIPELKSISPCISNTRNKIIIFGTKKTYAN